MNLIEEKLTNREEQVYNYLLHGLSYSDMEEEMGIKKTSIVTYVMNIFLKKMVNSRYELMANRILELEQKIDELQGTNCNTRANLKS